MATQQPTQNIDPQNAYHWAVNFTTTNLSNGNQFLENHTVTMANGTFLCPGNIPLNSMSIQGNAFGPCIVVPLSTNTQQGSYWIKIHLPQNNESVMYITFAQKNNNKQDGFYDYVNGIPDALRTALRNWIKDDRLLPISSSPQTLYKGLKFTVKGIDTNQTSASVEFMVKFAATFGGTVISNPPISTPTFSA